jgi:hypothetical protein
MIDDNGASTSPIVAEGVNLPGADDNHSRMHKMILGASIAQLVRCAALFSFADHLASGPTTAEAIAAAEGLDADATYRLMRACSSFGLLIPHKERAFAATPLLRTLGKDDALSLRDLAIMQGGKAHWGPLGSLDQAVRTGRPQDEATLGAKIWDYYASPEGECEGVAVSRVMARTLAADAVTAQQINTSEVLVAADIGGAGGSLIRALMRLNPSLRGVLLDLPHVVADASKAPENLALSDRLSIQAGSFFEEVPTADLYLLRWILHDWGDRECLSILRNCRRAAAPRARIIIIELVLEDGPPSQFASQLDLTMMAALGGRERTLEEFTRLLQETGFTVTRSAGLVPPFSMIEAIVN